MPIIFKSKLSSSTTNATFLDKTINDETIGLLGLNAPLSGLAITNTQLSVNQNSKLIIAESAISASGTIPLDADSMNQEHRVVGDGSAISLNILPFTGAKVVNDGSIVNIVGHSDTNTVTVALNDVQFGCYINGDAVLLRGYILTLIYNDELERYIEVGRNF
ncbi:MAG: hypothetical protein ACI9IA_000225 [Enterobacterales bacterium]|jgi:hypothetical protein